MPSPTISHIIGITALITMIFVTQFFYFYVVDNVRAEMARKELKENVDYVSDTLENLFFLVNSTSSNVTLEKDLKLPSDIIDSTYIIEISYNESNFVQEIHAYLKGNPSVDASSWIIPGLKVDQTEYEIIDRKSVV